VVRQPAERGQTVGRLMELRANRQCGGSMGHGAWGMGLTPAGFHTGNRGGYFNLGYLRGVKRKS